MATVRELIAQGGVLYRRPDWEPDEYVHAVWALQGRDHTLTDLCLCHAPPDFPDSLLNDDQWEPGGPPGLEVEVTAIPLETLEAPFYMIGKPMQA